MTLKYRPEIDGLRAIAVCSVLIYHANFKNGDETLLSGGFLGVDIFFVISGYLITKIIFQGLQDERFSIASFYDKRARRILPALFVVMASTLAVAWFWLSPKAMTELAGSALASLAFASNFYFWGEESYWAEPSALKPLLHTWSLAVEEQFYVFYPVILIVVWRFFRNHILTASLCLLGLSLALAEYGSRAAPEAAFFLIPFRGWELLAGAVLVFLETGRKTQPLPANIRRLLPLLGLTLIVVSFGFFTEQTRHPSVWTIFPVLGTALIIHFSNPDDTVTSLLSTRPFVWIGKISYSLYLWHFPILALAQVRYETLSVSARIFCLVLAVALATASYFWIEQPARNKARIELKIFAPVIAAATILLGGSYAALFLTNGYPPRLGDTAKLFAETEQPSTADGLPETCAAPNQDNDCPSAKLEKGLLVLGDSHAQVFKNAVQKIAERNGVDFNFRALGSCPHVDVKQVKFGECDKFRAQTADFMTDLPPSIIVYAVHWRKYNDTTEEGKYRGTVVPHNGETLHQAYGRQFNEWLEAGHTLVIIYPGLETEEHLPRKVKTLADQQPEETRAEFLNKLSLTTTIDEHVARVKSKRDFLDALPDNPQLIRIDPLELFCDETKNLCNLNNGPNLYIKDYTHYSPYAINILMSEVEKSLPSTSLKQ